MSNLKLCPFCGSEARISTEWDTDGLGNFHSVKCGKCGAESAKHFASSGNDCPQHYAEVRSDWNQRQDDWISVEERLPEESGVYLCYLQGEDYKYIKVWCKCYDAERKKFNDYQVTHWMSKPADPKAE